MPHYLSDELYDACREGDHDDQQYWINKHYRGWEHLIRPCIDRAVARGHTIQQIKAKFGTLRFYWTSGPILAGEITDEVMHTLVSQAEAFSEIACTRCGLEDQQVAENRGHCNLCKAGWFDRMARKMGVKPHEYRFGCECDDCILYNKEEK